MRTFALAALLFAFNGFAQADPPGVRRVAEGKYVVDRTYLDTKLQDLNAILSAARAVPHFEDGAVVGYSLTQIKPDSIYGKLGLKNGDVILGVNGKSLDSPATTLYVITSLRGATHVDVKLKRKKQILNHVYDVAEPDSQGKKNAKNPPTPNTATETQ